MNPGVDGERIRVLQAITRMIVGGAQLHTLHLCQRLNPLRYESELLTGPELGSEGDLLTTACGTVPTTIIESLGRELRPLRDLQAYRLILEHMKRRRFHIVHTNTSKAGILARRAARAAGVPIVLHTVHGWQWTPARSGPMNRFIIATERWGARLSDRLIVVAEKDREKGLAAKVGRPEQYVLIESSIALERFDPNLIHGGEFRRAHGIPPGAPVAGTIGRFAPQKAPALMLAAARRILEADAEAHFVYVGDGPLREGALRQVGGLADHPRFHLEGIHADVAPILAAFDVFVLSSLYEGLPRVVVEAMVMQKPVVSTPADGVVDVVRPGRTGVLVPHGDADALARETLSLLHDRNRAQALGRSARESALGKFELQSMVERTEQLYEVLLKEKHVG